MPGQRVSSLAKWACCQCFILQGKSIVKLAAAHHLIDVVALGCLGDGINKGDAPASLDRSIDPGNVDGERGRRNRSEENGEAAQPSGL